MSEGEAPSEYARDRDFFEANKEMLETLERVYFAHPLPDLLGLIQKLYDRNIHLLQNFAHHRVNLMDSSRTQNAVNPGAGTEEANEVSSEPSDDDDQVVGITDDIDYVLLMIYSSCKCLCMPVEIRLANYVPCTLQAVLACGAKISAIRPEAIPREYWVEMENKKSLNIGEERIELTHHIKDLPLWIHDINGEAHKILVSNLIIFPGLNADIIIGYDVLQHYPLIGIDEYTFSFII